MTAAVLQTPRTILRPYTQADAADLYAFSSIPAVGVAAGWAPHRSLEESREIIRTVFAAPWTFAVEERGTGRVIGSAGFNGHRRGQYGREDELGYALHPGWWGRGIMTEVVRELLRCAFVLRGLDAVWASHYEENPASRRVIEKCGFSPAWSGALTDDTGEHQTHFYVLLRRQWEGEGL